MPIATFGQLRFHIHHSTPIEVYSLFYRLSNMQVSVTYGEWLPAICIWIFFMPLLIGQYFGYVIDDG